MFISTSWILGLWKSRDLLLVMCCVLEHVAAGGYHGNGGGSKLLVFLVDGCRWDYVGMDAGLVGFPKMAEMGARAPHVTPVFPSNSYPNWYSMVTGLYAESHGFVQNMMYDPYYGDFFLMAPNDTSSVPHWWDGAEPLWVTAEKRGIRSALYWWDGCQVEIRGRKPTYCRKYKYVGNSWPTVKADVQEALQTSLELFASDEIQLVMVYYELVDFYGHKYGPYSDERKQAVREVDRLLNWFQTELENRLLDDEVNVVVVSDHGMTPTDSRELNVIHLQHLVDVSDIRYMVYYGATSMILPHDGKLDKLYYGLKGTPGLSVYRKEEIPEHYHMKNNRLTLPLLLVAAKNYYIQGLDLPGKSIPTGSSISLGSHGYDPYEVADMGGIFYARGPGVRQRHVTPPLQTIDIYNILCELLGIEPLPNNGTKNLSKTMLTQAYKSNASSHSSNTYLFFTVAASYLCCLLLHRRNSLYS